MNLSNLFNPRSVAVIGASDDPRKISYSIFKNLLSYKTVYPVNPNHKEISGMKCYPTVESIRKKIDLGIIAVPSKVVPEIIKKGKNVRNWIIISAGFSEAGDKKLEEEILALAKKNKQRIIGPNCMGIQIPNIDLNATFMPRSLQKGNVAFISQSGGFCAAMLFQGEQENVGLSALVSVGNMIDVDIADMIEYFDKDKNTSAIAIYLEGLKDGRKFLDAAKNCKKPIVVLKIGKTEEGKKAAVTHTGSMAGSYEIYQGAFRQANIIEVKSTEELFDLIKAFTLIKNAKKEVIIITNGGGLGTAAADAVEENGLILKEITKEKSKELIKAIPFLGNSKNPIDLTGNATTSTYETVIDILGKENASFVIILIPTAVINPEKAAISTVDLSRKKPVVACWMSGEFTESSINLLRKSGVASFESPERAVRVLGKLA